MKKLKNPVKECSRSFSKYNSLFTKGYSPVRERVEKGSRFVKSCYNCAFFYQAVGDKEEVCQNPNVLKYDMVITESNIYCSHWKISPRKQSVKGLFKGVNS